MKRRGSDRRRPAACAELHAEDGTNPRDDRRDGGRGGLDRKARQVARLAERAIAAGLAALGDPRLYEVRMERVEVSGSTLTVYVCAPAEQGDGSGPAVDGPTGHGSPDPDRAAAYAARRTAALAALAGARGFLRSCLARELNRRRVPELRFVWSEVDGGQP